MASASFSSMKPSSPARNDQKLSSLDFICSDVSGCALNSSLETLPSESVSYFLMYALPLAGMSAPPPRRPPPRPDSCCAVLAGGSTVSPNFSESSTGSLAPAVSRSTRPDSRGLWITDSPSFTPSTATKVESLRPISTSRFSCPSGVLIKQWCFPLFSMMAARGILTTSLKLSIRISTTAVMPGLRFSGAPSMVTITPYSLMSPWNGEVASEELLILDTSPCSRRPWITIDARIPGRSSSTLVSCTLTLTCMFSRSGSQRMSCSWRSLKPSSMVVD